MYSSLNQRFSRAGFNGIPNDTERKVSCKPNSLDCSITITNDVYGPPPSAIRAKMLAERRNAALASKTRPIQSAPHNDVNSNHVTPGKHYPDEYNPPSTGPSIRGSRVPHPYDRSIGKPTWDDHPVGRGRGRIGSNSGVLATTGAEHSRGPLLFHENPPPIFPPAFRATCPVHNPFLTNPPSGSDFTNGTRGTNDFMNYGHRSASRRSAPPRRGTAGRVPGSRHPPGLLGTAQFDHGLRSNQLNLRTPRRNYNLEEHERRYMEKRTGAINGNTMWTTNPYSRPYRGGKFDCSSSSSRGTYSSVWMHDDRCAPFHPFHQNNSAKSTASRYGKRNFSDRKFDARAFVNVPSTDEYIDDFTPEDLAKYKLEINMESFTVHSPLSSDPILRTPLSKWDSDVLRYSPDRDIIALHSPILFDSDDTDDLEFGQQQIPASNRRSKRYTPTHQLTDSGIAIPSTGPNRHSGSQRGRAAATAVNGTGRSGADSRHRRQSGSMLRPGDSKINGTKPVTGQTTLSERSEHTSESADQTSSSLITSSTHPSTGIADDSGLGESIKPLQSTKSCQDLVSLNVSLHALHFPRSQSWPELHLLNLSDAAYHDEDDVAHEDQATNGDLLLHQCTIVTRTRSCGALSKDLTDSVLDVPIRRINSLPNWSVMDRGDDGDATQPQFDDHNQPVVENIKQERNTAKHETVEPVSS